MSRHIFIFRSVLITPEESESGRSLSRRKFSVPEVSPKQIHVDNNNDMMMIVISKYVKIIADNRKSELA